jgi:branched-subunit amino acid transport protein
MAPVADVPAADPRWSTHGSQSAPARSSAPQRTPPRLPPGFRWIAVRPGAAPPARRGRSSLGPTPRYAVIPRWGLTDHVEQAPAAAQQSTRTGPSAAAVRLSLFVSVLVLGSAALVYVVRYVLLAFNRKTLLNSIVAIAADWLGVLASVAGIATAFTASVLLIQWLIARRAAVFAHYGLSDQRSVRAGTADSQRRG